MIYKGIVAIAGFANIVIIRILIEIMLIMMTMTGIAAIAGSAMIAATMAESLDAPFLQVLKSSSSLSN